MSARLTRLSLGLRVVRKGCLSAALAEIRSLGLLFSRDVSRFFASAYRDRERARERGREGEREKGEGGEQEKLPCSAEASSKRTTDPLRAWTTPRG